MSQQHDCPKCRSIMREGFVLDESHGARLVSRWIDGAPVKSMWLGVKIKGHDSREIASWRCTSCGFLENYAL